MNSAGFSEFAMHGADPQLSLILCLPLPLSASLVCLVLCFPLSSKLPVRVHPLNLTAAFSSTSCPPIFMAYSFHPHPIPSHPIPSHPIIASIAFVQSFLLVPESVRNRLADLDTYIYTLQLRPPRLQLPIHLSTCILMVLFICSLRPSQVRLCKATLQLLEASIAVPLGTT